MKFEKTIYEIYVKKAFNLVNDVLLSLTNDLAFYKSLGKTTEIKQVEKKINDIYYSINLFARYRQTIDRYFDCSKITCLSKSQLKGFQDSLGINCNICQDSLGEYYDDVLKIFEATIPICNSTSVFTYEWGGNGECLGADLVSEYIIEYQNGVAVRAQNIPIGYTSSQIKELFGTNMTNAQAEELFETRIIEVDYEFCCGETSIFTPQIHIRSAQGTSFTFEYNIGNASFALIEVYDGQVQIYTNTVTTNTGIITIPNLSISSSYLVKITSSNCFGSAVSDQIVLTLPYIVTVILEDELEQEGDFILYNGVVFGDNIVSNYGQSYSVSFDQLVNYKYFNVSLVTLNGEPVTPIWTKQDQGYNLAGIVTIPSVTQNYVIVISGSKTNNCQYVNTTINNNEINFNWN